MGNLCSTDGISTVSVIPATIDTIKPSHIKKVTVSERNSRILIEKCLILQTQRLHLSIQGAWRLTARASPCHEQFMRVTHVIGIRTRPGQLVDRWNVVTRVDEVRCL